MRVGAGEDFRKLTDPVFAAVVTSNRCEVAGSLICLQKESLPCSCAKGLHSLDVLHTSAARCFASLPATRLCVVLCLTADSIQKSTEQISDVDTHS